MEERWDGLQAAAQRPIGDLLEEILGRGPSAFPRYASLYPAAPLNNRVSILLAGLALGPEIAEVVRDHLSRRESPEKWALATGLGEMGHPEVEGYFARVLREKPSVQAMLSALSCLGRVRGRKSLSLLIDALDQPYLFEAACKALAAYGGPEAVSALIPRQSELAAFRSLAAMGAPEARELFVRGLSEGAPRSPEAARGLGRLSDPALGHLLLPLLASGDEGEAAAAFEAYAALGAPEGVEPLLRAAEGELLPQMISALAGLDHPAVHRRLLSSLSGPARPRLLDRLRFWRRREKTMDEGEVRRALRQATDPEVLRALAARLSQETEAAALREILWNATLVRSPEHGGALVEAWRRDDLLARYVVARALLQAPSLPFLSEALDFLRRPGFCEMDRASAWADEEHALGVYARENNPCLLVGGLLDSGFVDLETLRGSLEGRLAAWRFPSGIRPREALNRPEDRDAGAFLESLAEAHPAIREAVWRLWNLLAELEDQGDPLLDLFLCATGSHRGGIQRAILQGLPGCLGRYLEGKDDRHLSELDGLLQHIPAEGPLRQPLRELLERGRRALMSECRDMALFGEGSAKGDMVLIEELRGGG